MVDLKAPISIKACSTYDDFMWQVKVRWMRHDNTYVLSQVWKTCHMRWILLYKGSKQEKSEWDMSWCAYVVSDSKAYT